MTASTGPATGRTSWSSRSARSSRGATFARRVFFWAGIYGIAVLAPQYLLEDALRNAYPPALTHPEHFYGLLGVALAWQFAFLLIAHDVVRHRLLMLPAMVEKFSFAASVFALHARGRVPSLAVGFAAVDLVLGILFVIAFVASREHSAGDGDS